MNYSLGQLRGAYAAGRRDGCSQNVKPSDDPKTEMIRTTKRKMHALIDLCRVDTVFGFHSGAGEPCNETLTRCCLSILLTLIGYAATWDFVQELCEKLREFDGPDPSAKTESAVHVLESRFRDMVWNIPFMNGDAP